jgi:hypothetical protein
MTKAARGLGLYCLFCLSAMFAGGMAIRLSVVPPGPGTAVAAMAHLYLLWLLAVRVLGRPNGPHRAVSAAGRIVPQGDPSRRPAILELFLAPSRLTALLAAMALVLDLAYLGLILGKIPAVLIVSRLPLHPSFWGTAAVSLYLAAMLIDRGPGLENMLWPFALVLAHLLLTVLGHDVFACRGLVLVLAAYTLLLCRGLGLRLSGPALAGLYLALEGLILGSGLFGYFHDLDWLNPLSGPALALDYGLKEAIFLTSGFGGLGLQYLARLDLVKPELMHLNGFSYLSAWLGEAGVMAYAFLNLSVMLILVYAVFRFLKERLAILILPFVCLLASGQYAALLYYLAWRGFGLTHGPAFVGGYDTGLAILVAAVMLFDPRAQKGSQGLSLGLEGG